MLVKTEWNAAVSKNETQSGLTKCGHLYHIKFS